MGIQDQGQGSVSVRRLSPPLTMDEVAALTGGDGRQPWDVQRVRRHLLKLNEELHGTLLANAGGTGYGARWTITWANLRRVMPHWFDGKKTTGDMLDEVQQSLKALSIQVLTMDREHEKDLKVLSSQMIELAKRLDRQKREQAQAALSSQKTPFPRVG